MEWSPEAKLTYLMSLSWTVRAERDPDEGYLVLRVAELPSVIATGSDEKALENDFWESLRASLEAALEFADPIQLPKGARVPWEPSGQPTPLRNVLVKQGTVAAYIPEPKQTAAPAAVNEVPRELAVA